MRDGIYCVIYVSAIELTWCLFLLMMDSESDCSDSWTDSRTLKFIELFRFHECLWKVNSDEHSDRIKRQQAMRNIASELNVTGY